MNILILTGKFGMGHLAASDSLRQQLSRQFPESSVEIVDFVGYALPGLSDTLYKGFHLLVTHADALFNLYYLLTSHGRPDARPPFAGLLLDRLAVLLCEKRPDAVIATHPLCAQLISLLKGKTGLDLPLITCITDVSSHPEWINRNTDCYLVPTPEIRTQMGRYGVDSRRVCVTGIPVREEFRQLCAKAAAPALTVPALNGDSQQAPALTTPALNASLRQASAQAAPALNASLRQNPALTASALNGDSQQAPALADPAQNASLRQASATRPGFPEEQMPRPDDDTQSARSAHPDGTKHLLLMGGGLGILPEDMRFYEELSAIPNTYTTVVTGQNQKLYRRLCGRFSNIEALGYTSRIWEYMARADLIVTKPGGITLFETIFSGVPVYTLKPALQQERGNARWLAARGIGWSAGPGDCAWEIRLLLQDSWLLAQARARMAHIREQFESESLCTILTALAGTEAAGPQTPSGADRSAPAPSGKEAAA